MQNTQVKMDMEELAAMAAHEIKNPLSIIKANLQLMQIEDVDEKFKKNCEVINHQVDIINALVLDFIQLSKPRQYKFEKLSLDDLLGQVLRSFQAPLMQKNIALEYEPYEDTLWVLADRDRLSQVFINLLKNAIEAVPEKGVIHVMAFPSEGYVSIKIEDNGKGIPEKYLHKIGKPFFTTKEGGNGLGLTISKRIIEDHKGVLTISSVEGKGSAVAITLPEYSCI